MDLTRPGEIQERFLETVCAAETYGRITGRRRGRRLRAALRFGAGRNRAVHEAELGDGGTAEEGIDSLAKRARLVLEEHRCRGLGAERQHPAGWSLGQFHRLGEARDLGTDDIHPAQHERGIGKAGARKSGGPEGSRTGDRLGAVATNRFFGGVLFARFASGHGGTMQSKRNRAQSPQPEQLLAWYDRHRRELPWRAKRGTRADPYRVWLSEIMLQQTTVAAVAGYYRKFLERWPTVEALADAPLDDVLAAWAGLGYYARARNLHKAAGIVAREMGGRFPGTAEELRKLPGIGAYTSGAIAAIAFDECEAAVDANAERVLARLYAIDVPMPNAKPELRRLGQALMPETRAGDFVQALMDLGATICTPKRPACGNCPWTDNCEARRKGIAETLPRKGAERVRPLKRGAAFIVRDAKDRVLVVKRPEKGLLGGMLEPPLGPWAEAFPSRAEAMLQAPFRGEWTKRAGVVRHGFTHFELEVEVYVMSERGRPARNQRSTQDAAETAALRHDAIWIPTDKLKDAALPTVMRKIIAHGLDDGGPLFAKPDRRAVAGAKRRSK